MQDNNIYFHFLSLLNFFATNIDSNSKIINLNTLILISNGEKIKGLLATKHRKYVKNTEFYRYIQNIKEFSLL